MKLEWSQRTRAAGTAIAFLFSLAACGGGGGGGSVRPDPPPTSQPPDVEPAPVAPEIDAHLVITNVYEAHNGGVGVEGRGITIGIVDTGVRRDHPTLDGRVLGNLSYVGSETNDLTVDDAAGHGTAVAQIAAGSVAGDWPGGFAPGAILISARVIPDDAAGGEPWGSDTVSNDLFVVNQDLIVAGAKIMNNSWGGWSWAGEELTESLVDAYRPFVIDHGGIVVFATGDGGGTQPSKIAALPSQAGNASDLEQGWLAVAAVDTNDPTQLASYSNGCGVAMNYCLVAPGDVVVTGVDDDTGVTSKVVVNGTHFAAPQVTGAAAIVWEAFPYFDADLVRQTLLGSATDLGEPGVDPVFGHGLLNLKYAIRGPSRFDWGDVTVSPPAKMIYNSWWNGISGEGGLTVNGGGNVIDLIDDPSLSLGGENTFTGGLNLVNGMTMTINDDFTSDIFIDSTSYLYAWETTLLGNVEIHGLLAINTADDAPRPAVFKGNVINQGILYSRTAGNTTFEGNYHQGSQATFMTVLGTDPLRISGEAHLDGELHIFGVAEGYVPQQKTEILVAEGGVFGEFALWTIDPSILLDASLWYGSDRVWIDVDRVATASVAGMSYSASSLGAARRVDKAFVHLDERLAGPAGDEKSAEIGDFLSAAGTLQRTSSNEVLDATLSSLSGEQHAADAAFTMMALDDSRHLLEARLDSLDHGLLQGTWADRLGGQQSMWSTTRLDTQGWMIGQDYRFSADVTLGAAFGQSNGYASHTVRGDRERNRQVEGQLYGAWKHDAHYVMGRMARGQMDRWMQRDILLGSQRFDVQSEYANQYTTLGVQAGHRFDIGRGTMTPYVGAQALRLERGAFAEQGAAGFGLATDGSVLEASQALAGARLERQWSVGATRISLQGRMEWQRTLSQSGDAIDARFTGLDAWSPITGAGLGEEATVFGFGVHAWLPVGGKLGFELDSRHENGRSYTGAFANWSVGF